MPFSSGTFTYTTSGLPVVTGTTISSTVKNNQDSETATGLSACLLKDGTQTVTANIPFAGFGLTQVGNYPMVCEFRLTLTTAVPVTTGDVTAATTLFAAPYKGNRIALYDGSNYWNTRTSVEFSIAVPATTNTLYDVFCYDNSGTPTLELTAWTNDTTRATALTTQNGVLVKTGATTRRYLGSFRTTGSSGQTEDSLAKRYVWNYYNRVLRPMKVVEATNTWTYSTTAYRQANASTANQLDYVQGVSEDAVTAEVIGVVISSTATFRAGNVGIGVDSTTANSALIRNQASVNNTFAGSTSARYKGFPGVGRHTLVWLEQGGDTDTQTWYGDNGDVFTQTGIVGEYLG